MGCTLQRGRVRDGEVLTFDRGSINGILCNRYPIITVICLKIWLASAGALIATSLLRFVTRVGRSGPVGPLQLCAQLLWASGPGILGSAVLPL